MTPKPSQCTHVTNGKRCKVQVWKAGERFCISHDILAVIAKGALQRVTAKHARTCSYWIFSGDRHCSCGRDQARGELDQLRAAISNQNSKERLRGSIYEMPG